MATSLWIGHPDVPAGGTDTEASRAVLGAEGEARGGSHEVVAWPQRDLPEDGTLADYVAAHRLGVRTFTLWRDPRREEVFARVATLTTFPGQGAEYEVRDADGQALAVIRRAPASLSRLHRERWSVRQLDQPDRQPATGWKGGIVPWRTRLRSGGETVLRWRGENGGLEVLAEWWDPRVVAAFVVLIASWGGRLTEKTTDASYV